LDGIGKFVLAALDFDEIPGLTQLSIDHFPLLSRNQSPGIGSGVGDGEDLRRERFRMFCNMKTTGKSNQKEEFSKKIKGDFNLAKDTTMVTYKQILGQHSSVLRDIEGSLDGEEGFVVGGLGVGFRGFMPLPTVGRLLSLLSDDTRGDDGNKSGSSHNGLHCWFKLDKFT